MARGRSILAIYLALVLVILPVSVAWSISPFPEPSARGNTYTDGGGECGHPWDDGTGETQPQPGGTDTTLTAKAALLPPPIVPVLTTGGGKWIGGALIYLWQKVTHTKISPKSQYSRQR
jgi:hypothetical protein